MVSGSEQSSDNCFQDYLEVLCRPLALSFVESWQWTSSRKMPLAHRDNFLVLLWLPFFTQELTCITGAFFFLVDT